MQTTPVISPDQVEAFWREGFVPVHDILRPEEVERLRRRADEIMLGVVDFPAQFIQTEPELGQPLAVDRRMGIRKIANLALHDPVFAELLTHPNVVRIATAILGSDVKLLLDQMLCKPAMFGSAKPYHQDGPYWPIEPMDHCTLWIALDDATRLNGCMRFLPGSHKFGPLPHDETLGHHRMPPGWEHLSQRPDEVAVEVKAGSGTCHHALVLHETADNRTPARRRAMTLVFMKSTARWTSEAPKPTFLPIAGGSYEGCI